ncbi:MAG: hypothetical protein KKC18_02850 [Chloroflexi bacterium]|nr:hypothetical protein [Chloroflexota bacterium]
MSKPFCLCLLGILLLGPMGCQGIPASPQATYAPTEPATPITTPKATEIPPSPTSSPSPSPSPVPTDTPIEFLHVADPAFGLSWTVPRNWWGIEEQWPSPPELVLLSATASEKEAVALLSASPPTFPNGLMVLAVYATTDALSYGDREAQPLIVSQRPGWVQEATGDAAAPFSWRVTLFIQGTSEHNYRLSFECAPPSAASAAEQAGFKASCRYIWGQILGGVEVTSEEPCLAPPTPTPGPVAWRRVSDEWYKYSFEIPSGWYEEQGATPDRLTFFSDPALLEQSPYCPSSDGLMKLDFGADPVQGHTPDLAGMNPTTIAGRSAWVGAREGGEAAPSTFTISAHISGSEYWYSLWLGCIPSSAENKEAFVAECQSTMDHVLESFQIEP